MELVSPGLSYGKPEEQQYAVGFLEKVVQAMLKQSEATAGAHP